MRLHRFYIPEELGKSAEHTIISTELVHQLRHVFRLRAGDGIIAFDGSGSEYTCAIASYAGDDRVVLSVRSSARARFTPSQGRKIWLFTALIKKDNFETVVEKATELGVTDIVPVLAERSEKKAVNEGRLRKIAIEAAEQSGRGDIPKLHPMMTLSEALSAVSDADMDSIAFHTEGDPFDPQEFTHKDRQIACFIGPEGGWSPDEIALFHGQKTAVRSLGPQVLRAETAAVAALSQVVFRA